MWHRDAVVYQVYPRSFQDSDGDGLGDLPGITARLDHIAGLGVDALWLSPIYPSPDADLGYDVTDHCAVDPRLGTLADFDALLAGAHARGLAVLLDLIPCHTSIEHPWFRAHPDRYVKRAGERPPNNWVAVFGGPAWSRDPLTGEWYLHSFYPEQPDLDWRQAEVPGAVGDVVRFWRARGADGFRLDALDRLLKDPELRDDPPARAAFALPLLPEYAALDHVHSDGAPDIGDAVAELRAAAGDAALVGEVFQPSARLAPYLPGLDAAFCFELFFAGLDAARVRAAIEGALAAGKPAWVLSNHDFPRLATRLGSEALRVAAMLLLTLPGPAFVYQGDEIGLADGPGHDPPYDRAGRDGARHPMPWDAGPHGGFSTGEPWLPVVGAAGGDVVAQERERGSLLWLYRDLIAARRELAGAPLRFLDGTPRGTLAYERGEHVVALNLGSAVWADPPGGETVLATHAADGALPPLAGRIVRRG